MKSSKVCMMTDRTGWKVTASVMGNSRIFPGSHNVQLRLFYIHSTAIPCPVRQSCSKYDLTQSSFERVEQDRILNLLDVLDHHPVLIRLYPVCTTSIPFLIRVSSFCSPSAERSANGLSVNGPLDQ